MLAAAHSVKCTSGALQELRICKLEVRGDKPGLHLDIRSLDVHFKTKLHEPEITRAFTFTVEVQRLGQHGNEPAKGITQTSDILLIIDMDSRNYDTIQYLRTASGSISRLNRKL